MPPRARRTRLMVSSPPRCARSRSNFESCGSRSRAASRKRRTRAMFEYIRSRVLRLFRVPHDPDPPSGAPGSVRVFRAGRNFYKLRLARWGLGQVAALVGIIASLVFLGQLERTVDDI